MLAIWAAYLILRLLPLHSTGLESRRHWVADPFYHHFSRNFSQSVAISVAVSVAIPIAVAVLWRLGRG